MRTRAHDWFDLKTRQPIYGIDVFDGTTWCHAAENGKPLFFETAKERDLKRAEVRKWKAAEKKGGAETLSRVGRADR